MAEFSDANERASDREDAPSRNEADVLAELERDLQGSEQRKTGGRGGGGGGGGGGQDVRSFMQLQDYVCYKVRCNRASKLNDAIALMVKLCKIKISCDPVLEEARRPWKINGADGKNSGAARCIFFPRSQIEQLRPLAGEGGNVEAGFQKKGVKVCMEVIRCRLGGARGRTAFGLYGLDDSIAAKSCGVFTCKAAIMSDALIKYWAGKFGHQEHEARFQVVRSSTGVLPLQGRGPVDVFGNFIEVAAEFPQQAKELSEIDLGDLALDPSMVVPALQRMDVEEYFAAESAKIVAGNGQGSAEEDPEHIKRSLVFFNLKNGLGEEEVREAAKQAVLQGPDKQRFADSDIEDVAVLNTARGNVFCRVLFASLAAADKVFWVEGSPLIQALKDGRGPQGVRIVRDRPAAQRRRNVDMRPGSAAEQGRRSAWQNDMMPAPRAATIDYGKLSELIVGKMIVRLTEESGSFRAMMDKIVKDRVEAALGGIRSRLDQICDAMEGQSLQAFTPEEGDSSQWDRAMAREETDPRRGDKRPAPSQQVDEEALAQHAVNKMFSGGMLDSNSPLSVQQQQQALMMRLGMFAQEQAGIGGYATPPGMRIPGR